MFTDSMTANEIIREFDKDFPDIFSVSDKKQGKVDRMVRKSRQFPVYAYARVNSGRNNPWLVLWECKSKKMVGDDCLMSLIAIPELLPGRHAVMMVNAGGNPIYMMFVPHFFNRYAQRAGVRKTGDGLIRHFFRNNMAYSFASKNEKAGDLVREDVFVTCEEGIAMGVRVVCDKTFLLLKTFITHGMSKGEQIGRFAGMEQLRKEIHDGQMKEIMERLK